MRYELGLGQDLRTLLWSALKETLEGRGFQEVFAFSDAEAGREVAQFRRGDDIASLELDTAGGQLRVGLESETYDLKGVVATAVQRMARALLADLLRPLVTDDVSLGQHLEAWLRELFGGLGL